MLRGVGGHPTGHPAHVLRDVDEAVIDPGQRVDAARALGLVRRPLAAEPRRGHQPPVAAVLVVEPVEVVGGHGVLHPRVPPVRTSVPGAGGVRVPQPGHDLVGPPGHAVLGAGVLTDRAVVAAGLHVADRSHELAEFVRRGSHQERASRSAVSTWAAVAIAALWAPTCSSLRCIVPA